MSLSIMKVDRKLMPHPDCSNAEASDWCQRHIDQDNGGDFYVTPDTLGNLDLEAKEGPVGKAMVRWLKGRLRAYRGDFSFTLNW